MRILLTGGGTGGHITPIAAVVKEIKKTTKEDVEFLFVGLVDDKGREMLGIEGIKVKNISCGKMRRYFSLQNFIDPFKVFLGIFQAFWHVYIFMPDVVFAKGGYASVPGSFAAWFFRVPIISHESDSVPGLANKIVGEFAKIVIVAFQKPFEYFPKDKTVLFGNPIRNDILEGSAEECRRKFGLSGNKPLIYVTGGSQGAAALNKAILEILPKLLENAEVIHQCGKLDFENVKKNVSEILGVDYAAKGYHPMDFIGEGLKDVFAASSLIISRAGANSLAEISALGKPSILIPLPGSASDHQKINAFEYSKSGASIVIEQENLTPNLFLTEIKKVLDNPELARAMGENAKKLAHPDAAGRIAEIILKFNH